MKMMKMKNVMAALAVVGMTLFAASGAQAALLGIQQAFPDIASPGVDTTYDADTDTLTITGFSSQLTEVDGSTQHTLITNHTLTANIDDTGAFLGGTLVFDTVGLPPAANPAFTFAEGTTVLSIQLTGYGISGVGDQTVMDFFGQVSSVDPEIAPYFAQGSPIGVIYSAGSNVTFTGDWLQDWAAESGTTNTFVTIPTPSAAAAGLGLLGTLALRRRRRA